VILADAGYLIALFSRDDELHGRAVAWAASLVTEYVAWECVNFLSRPRHRQTAHAIVAWARAECEWLDATGELFQAGLKLHRERPDKAWSLTDCISFYVMSERGMTRALAYDLHFEQAGFEALLRRDPPA